MSADATGTNAIDESALDPIAAVAAFRATDAAQHDPVGFRVIEALARRAAVEQGEAGLLLVRRVQTLLAAHRSARTVAAPTAAPVDAPAARLPGLAGLSDLVDRLGRSSPDSEVVPAARGGALHPPRAAGASGPSPAAPPAPLRAVAAFKGTWSRLRADQRLRQALSQVPAMAGPLNSSHVMNRTLQTLRELSPEYLDAFMLHVDTLLWLEQASGGGAPSSRTAASADDRRRSAVRPVRKR